MNSHQACYVSTMLRSGKSPVEHGVDSETKCVVELMILDAEHFSGSCVVIGLTAPNIGFRVVAEYSVAPNLANSNVRKFGNSPFGHLNSG